MGPMHISLYVVLLAICEGPEVEGLFAVRREEVMGTAKIRCNSTYYRLMKELSEWGYVVYRPGRFRGSGVRVV